MKYVTFISDANSALKFKHLARQIRVKQSFKINEDFTENHIFLISNNKNQLEFKSILNMVSQTKRKTSVIILENTLNSEHDLKSSISRLMKNAYFYMIYKWKSTIKVMQVITIKKVKKVIMNEVKKVHGRYTER